MLHKGDGGDMDEMLGSRIRAVRESRNRSLRSLASSAGLSPSLISQIETGKSTLSLGNLHRIVDALGVPIDEVLRPSVPDTVPDANEWVQRGGERPAIEVERGLVWERMTPRREPSVDPLVITYAPGATCAVEGKMMRHPGVEYAYLLSGELTLYLDDEVVVVRALDSLSFESNRPHLFVNHTAEPATGVWLLVRDPQSPVTPAREPHAPHPGGPAPRR